MGNLINRQDAINTLNQMKIYRPLDSDRYIISDCLNKIVNLPSAQIKCKTGYWIHYDSDMDRYDDIKCSVIVTLDL